MELIKSPWISLFLLTVIIHLAMIGMHFGLAATITKCLLAPLLAIWIFQNDGPLILVFALIACFFGDLFLEFENDIWFLVGMGAFAIAQITFVVFFVRDGAFARLLTHWWVIPVLVLVGVGLLALVWGGLPTPLRIAMPIYAVLLLSMGALAFSTDIRAGFGAALFVFSDALIALRIAEILPRGSAGWGIVVMATYSAAIFLLATGLVSYIEKSATNDAATAAIDSKHST